MVSEFLESGHVSCPLPLPSGCLIDKKGKILIPGINDAVAPVTDEECELYDHIDFDMEEFAKDVGAETLLHSCKVPLAPPLTLCRPPAGHRGSGDRQHLKDIQGQRFILGSLRSTETESRAWSS